MLPPAITQAGDNVADLGVLNYFNGNGLQPIKWSHDIRDQNLIVLYLALLNETERFFTENIGRGEDATRDLVLIQHKQ